MHDVDERLVAHRNIWDVKPALRAVYANYHRRLLSFLPYEHLILEIGGGSGNFKATTSRVISIDLAVSPWVDILGDAHTLPFPESTFGGIAMLDVFHHLARPSVFFCEALRVLRPGGRLVMIEPGMTPFSLGFYYLFHQETVDMQVDPLADQPLEVAADPFNSNQAIASLLFDRPENRIRFQSMYPEFKILETFKFSLLAYPLSGGFKSWSLLPESFVEPLLRFEDKICAFLGPLMGFRIAVVLEKNL